MKRMLMMVYIMFRVIYFFTRLVAISFLTYLQHFYGKVDATTIKDSGKKAPACRDRVYQF